MNMKLLGAFAAVALLAACAKPATTSMSTGNGAAMTTGPAPGSEEDLVANVGDRVFYDFNASSLTTDATTTLSHQAGWAAEVSADRGAGGRQLRPPRHRGV